MKFLLAGLLSLVIASTAICEQQNIVVVFDASGSMGDQFSKLKGRIVRTEDSKKIKAAKDAIRLVLGGLPADTNIGIVAFGHKSGWFYKLGPLDKKELDKSIDLIQVGGGTPLGQYMKIGADALLEWRAKHRTGTYKLIIVTDGVSDDDVDGPLCGAYGILSKGIMVEAIGVDMSSRHTLATKVNYRSADSPEELKEAIKAVLAESTGNNDHSEDYDLIAPIPSEVALVALQALSEFDNSPIGQKPAKAKSKDSNKTSSSSSGIPTWVTVIGGVVVALGLLALFMAWLTSEC